MRYEHVPQLRSVPGMIVGVGIDLIEVSRINFAVNHPQTGRRFVRRVFTEEEIAYCMARARSAESFASRFAAKEATFKALGCLLPWRDVEVVRSAREAPRINLHGRAERRAAELGVRRLHVSLAHTATWAVAWVIAEGS